MDPIAPLALASRAYARSGPGAVASGGSSSALNAASAVTDKVGGGGFGSMVGNAMQSALQTLRHSERVTAMGVQGKADVQDVVQAASDAELTVKSTVAVLSKVQNAYSEIMRMGM